MHAQLAAIMDASNLPFPVVLPDGTYGANPHHSTAIDPMLERFMASGKLVRDESREKGNRIICLDVVV